MGMQETQKRCDDCGRLVLARRPGPNHVFHLILTILTGGLWLIVWILSIPRMGGWRCSGCGARV